MFRLHVMPHVTFHPRTVFTVCAVVTKAWTQIDHFRHYQLLVVAVSWNGKQNKYLNKTQKYGKSFYSFWNILNSVCPHVIKPRLRGGFI